MWTRYYNYKYICDRSVLLCQLTLFAHLKLYVWAKISFSILFWNRKSPEGWTTFTNLRLLVPSFVLSFPLRTELYLQRKNTWHPVFDGVHESDLLWTQSSQRYFLSGRGPRNVCWFAVWIWKATCPWIWSTCYTSSGIGLSFAPHGLTSMDGLRPPSTYRPLATRPPHGCKASLIP